MLPRFRPVKVVTRVSELHVTRCDRLRRLSFPKALADFSPPHTKQRKYREVPPLEDRKVLTRKESICSRKEG